MSGKLYFLEVSFTKRPPPGWLAVAPLTSPASLSLDTLSLIECLGLHVTLCVQNTRSLDTQSNTIKLKTIERHLDQDAIQLASTNKCSVTGCIKEVQFVHTNI